MGVLYEDTKSRFLREGRAEGEIQGEIKGQIKAVIAFMKKEGYTLEEAVDVVADESERDAIIEGVKLKLSADCLNK